MLSCSITTMSPCKFLCCSDDYQIIMSAVCRAPLKFPELSRRAHPGNTEESRTWQSGEWSMKEKKRCFISGAAEAWGSEVNVDFFLHMKRERRAAWVI